ncbi:MAG: mechanosensitive ion channel family protein [Granulosicoccus sp.]|nr:mechanosensitive ion channel family protein [Granulosicoccus sp.]
MLRSFVEHLPFLAGGMVTLVLTWGLANLISAFGTRVLGHWHKRESVKELIVRLLSIIIWVLGLLLTAIVLFPGLTPSKALGGLGLVSIAVGLAFKDIFENFFAGILILWRFPFERGDFIECEGLVGKVEKVMVRMSYIRETNGQLTVVPNSFLFKNPVTVLTSQPSRRVMLTTGVAYDVDVSDAVRIISQAVEACETLSPDKPVQVFPKAFGSSSIDIEIAWWTESTPLAVRRSTGEVVTAIKKALDEAGIEIPFPYRTLTFKEPLTVTQREN